MRGMLTDKIQEKAVLFLNREITQKELRLYPYIDYSIKNGCYGWSYDKMDEEEIKILNKLYDEKHIVYYPMRRKTPCFSYGDIRRVHRIYASN